MRLCCARVFVFAVYHVVVQASSSNCIPRAQWPSTAVAQCGEFSYSAHRNSEFSGPTAAVRALQAEFQPSLVTPKCTVAIQHAQCFRFIPACAVDGNPVQGCSSACDDLHLECAGALAEVYAKGGARSSRVRSLVDCYRWPFQASGGGTGLLCTSFSERMPCMTVESSKTAGVINAGVQPVASLCPSGLVVNKTMQETTLQPLPLELRRMESTSTDEYMLWPICMVVGLLLAVLSVGKTGSDKEQSFVSRLGRRTASVRFCTQLLLIVGAGTSSMVTFILVSRAESVDFNRVVADLESSNHKAALSLWESLREASQVQALFLSEQASSELRLDFRLFEEVHNVTIELMSRSDNKRTGEAVYDFLAGIQRSSKLQSLSLGCSVVELWRTNTSVTTLILHPHGAELVGEFATEDVHLGVIGTRRVMFDRNGAEMSTLPPSGFYHIPISEPPNLRGVIQEGHEELTGPLIAFGHVVLELGSTVFDTKHRPQLGFVSYFSLPTLRVFLLRHIREGERVVMFTPSPGNPILVSSHGLLSYEGNLVPVLSCSDAVISSLVSALVREQGAATPGNLTAGRTAAVADHTGLVHAVAVSRPRDLPFSVVVVAMIPVYMIESTRLDRLDVLRDDIVEAHSETVLKSAERLNFLLFVMILVMAIIFLISFAVAVGMTGGLNRLAKDLDDVTAFRLEVAVRSRSISHPSRFSEVQDMQGRIKTLVKKLLEIRHYLPDLSVISSDPNSTEKGLDEEDNDLKMKGEARLITERSCTVRVTHISRNLFKKSGRDSWMEDGSPQSGMHTISGRGRPMGEKTVSHHFVKKSSTFEWRYHDPSDASLVDFLKECRAAIGEPPGEPLQLTALVPKSEEESSVTEEFEIVYAHHLQDLLAFSPDELVIVSMKSSRRSLLSPIVAFLSVLGKLGLLWMMYRMWNTEGAQNVAVMLGAVLVLSFGANLMLGFKLNHKATRVDEQMRDWTVVFQTETTVVMVLCGFNVQNMLVLWSGLRIAKFLRFNAPMPMAVRLQAIRWSLFSLVVGDLIPLVIVVYFLSTEKLYDLSAALSSLTQVVAVVSSSVKKFVSFCLVDANVEKDAKKAKEKQERMQERIRRLSKVKVTIVRLQMEFYQKIVDEAPPEAIGRIINHYYNVCFSSVRLNKGTVIAFDNGHIEAIFNYPVRLHDHPRFGCTTVCQALRQSPHPEMLNYADIDEAWITGSIVSGEIVAGNLGSGTRRTLHRMGSLSVLSPMLCMHNTELGTQVLVNAGVAIHMQELVKQGRNHHAEFLIRPVDILVPPDALTPETVYQLLPVRTRDRAVSWAIAGNLQTFQVGFNALRDGELDKAADLLNRYLLCIAPMPDKVAELLLSRISASDDLGHFVRTVKTSDAAGVTPQLHKSGSGFDILDSPRVLGSGYNWGTKRGARRVFDLTPEVLEHPRMSPSWRKTKPAEGAISLFRSNTVRKTSSSHTGLKWHVQSFGERTSKSSGPAYPLKIPSGVLPLQRVESVDTGPSPRPRLRVRTTGDTPTSSCSSSGSAWEMDPPIVSVETAPQKTHVSLPRRPSLPGVQAGGPGTAATGPPPLPLLSGGSPAPGSSAPKPPSPPPVRRMGAGRGRSEPNPTFVQEGRRHGHAVHKGHNGQRSGRNGYDPDAGLQNGHNGHNGQRSGNEAGHNGKAGPLPQTKHTGEQTGDARAQARRSRSRGGKKKRRSHSHTAGGKPAPVRIKTGVLFSPGETAEDV
eukprot:Hpha_TRINITY_DN33646_c0_g1::TRINITY_DN33646_c0_g1_i1::g.43151::m.43151